MTSAAEQHTGILREENLALRQILGYRLETSQLCLADDLPQIGYYIDDTSIKDVLFVSINVNTGEGYEKILPGQSFHIGISIFDTRCLMMQDPGDAIRSYQFINTDSKQCKRAAKSFHFRKTDFIELSDLPRRFSLLTQGRDYVLVAHGIEKNTKFFNNIDRKIADRACYILDTVKAAQHPLQLSHRCSLMNLLKEFDIRYTKLHVAGNKAHFTLKALIMIAVRDGKMVLESVAAENERLFRVLDAIAHSESALPAKTEKPLTTPNPSKMVRPKPGVYAKRRLRAAAKLNRQLSQELPFGDGLDEKNSQDGEETPESSLP